MGFLEPRVGLCHETCENNDSTLLTASSLRYLTGYVYLVVGASVVGVLCLDLLGGRVRGLFGTPTRLNASDKL